MPLVVHVAALLAAGGGTRFRGSSHKLLAPLHDRAVWLHALDHVLAAGFHHVVVVTGAVQLQPPPPTLLRHNPRWSEGQATSLQVALEAARSLGASTVTVGLADQPFVPESAWQAVRDADPDCRIVVAEYDGRPGPHPVRFAAETWPLLPHTGDEGARDLLRRHPDWVCRVPCIGSVADIDTTEDLDRWKSC
ncbi:MAG: hypothetical protein RI900_2792 [Actinomycetota bacterium]